MTGLELPLTALAFLVAAAFVAGWIDSIVGGGGLVQLPALLIGLPPDTPVPVVAGTNKVPSAMGTGVAAWTYLRSIAVPWSAVVPLIAGAALGSLAGTRLTYLLAREWFNPIVLAAVVVVGVYTWRRPELGQTHAPRHEGAASWLRLAGLGLAVGAWDGFVGPGTGTFFLIGLVALMGYAFLQATALAKVANLTTNLAAITAFGIAGDVWWAVALLMGAANLLGGLLGSRQAVRSGNAFVRRVFLVVIGGLAAKLAWDTVVAFTA